MKQILSALVLLFAALPAIAQERAPLTLEQRMNLRCSAAFALVAHGQESGEASALAFPPMGPAAREFFVRAAAQVMDEAGLGAEEIRAELSAEARDLLAAGTRDAVVQTCLPQLVALQSELAD